MAMPERHLADRKYSYADYSLFTNDVRCEIIDGVIYDMTPAPNRKHQRIVGELHRQIANYLVGKDGEVYVAPFDVRLPFDANSDNEVYNVVQPDITVLCDKSKLDDIGCVGAPDWVIEVLSPSTGRKDKREKLRLYKRANVRLYWIVDPSNEVVEVFDIERNKFGEPEVYGRGDRVKIGIFDEFEVDFNTIFGK